MAIKLEMLRCFTAVAQRGSLAEAADQLGRTPSAVSMMLKQFEENIGAPLFETERKSRLTGLGQHILDQAVQALQHFDGTVGEMLSYARSESGSVRLAAVPSVASAVMPDVIRDFIRGRPGVHIDLRDLDSIAVAHELARGRIDVGIANLVGEGGDIVGEPFLSDRFGVVCQPAHSLVGHREPLEWHTLADHDFIANGSCLQIQSSEFRNVLEGSRMMVRNNTSLFSLIRAGIGITVLPELTMRGIDDVAFLPLADAGARRQVGILRSARAAPTPAVSAFLAALRAVRTEFQEI
ncbi:LysR family transcriptional regulator [Nitratireductor aquimarinus]|uniref:LysR family transcriptional regulator n=1 Tax=Nitratireductor aquimarinus TaxID=889300 RepID=A0ABU4AGD9_9HYPH|nr:LysR family transcriptional regulator [Nitratireductor aquimarinus]MDV6225302.1 LysR family transcriptional regulator [Nitratireductor aquimarinus]